MAPIPARRQYLPKQFSREYNASEIHQQLGLLAQSISPQITRTVVFASPTDAKVVLTTDDLIVCDTTAGSFALVLPQAVQVQFLRFSVINIGANTLTLTGTVSGAVNPTYAQWKSAIIQCDGVAFYKIGGVA